MKEHPIYRGYLVSEDGRVFNCIKKKRDKLGKYVSYVDYEKMKEMKPIKDRDGYIRICMCKDGEMKFRPVHRLVAETYLENPNNFPQVNHIDENKENNHISNLEWVTQQKNIEHSFAKYYLIENIETGELITVYNLKKWCKENNFHESGLLATLRGIRKHSGEHRIIKKWEKE
jgi:hypothetical protein